MPAAFWWNPDTPTAGVFSAATARNWTQPDTNGNWVRSAVVPGPADDLYFDGGVSSENCTIPDQSPVAPAVAFNGLHLKFGWLSASRVGPPTWTAYSGTVTIKDSFAVGTLEMESGAIKQADQVGMNPPVPLIQFAGTLTVNSNLTWTGGTLNSNYVAGKIDLAPGASGVAEPSFTNPGINQTVGLGSTIELLGTAVSTNTGLGGSMDVRSGDYQMSNGAGIVVNNQCSLRLLPAPADAPPGGGNPPATIKAGVTFVKELSGQTTEDKNGSITVKKGGSATFQPVARPAESNDPAVFKSDGYLFNYGGEVKILDTTTITFDGKAGDTPGLTHSVLQSGIAPESVFEIEGGCQILSRYGTVIGSGDFKITSATRNPTSQNVARVGLVAGSTATNAFILGGGVLSFPSGQVRQLHVTGNFAWSGGEIKLYLSSVTDPEKPSDRIEVEEGNLVITNTPKLKLDWNETAVIALAKDSLWHLMQVMSEGKEITGAFTSEFPNTEGKIQMDIGITPDKKEILARKKNPPQ